MMTLFSWENTCTRIFRNPNDSRRMFTWWKIVILVVNIHRHSPGCLKAEYYIACLFTCYLYDKSFSDTYECLANCQIPGPTTIKSIFQTVLNFEVALIINQNFNIMSEYTHCLYLESIKTMCQVKFEIFRTYYQTFF